MCPSNFSFLFFNSVNVLSQKSLQIIDLLRADDSYETSNPILELLHWRDGIVLASVQFVVAVRKSVELDVVFVLVHQRIHFVVLLPQLVQQLLRNDDDRAVGLGPPRNGVVVLAEHGVGADAAADVERVHVDFVDLVVLHEDVQLSVDHDVDLVAGFALLEQVGVFVDGGQFDLVGDLFDDVVGDLGIEEVDVTQHSHQEPLPFVLVMLLNLSLHITFDKWESYS